MGVRDEGGPEGVSGGPGAGESVEGVGVVG